MSTVEEKQITSSVENTTEENTKPTESKIKSPWEEVVIVPGSARIHNGRKLPTLTETLKNPKKVTASSIKPKIEVDSSLKPENKEQWNPVDLSHLLVTDAPQKPSRGSNKRNTANSSSKRISNKNNHQSRSKSHDKVSNKKSESVKLEKTHPRSNKSKFDTEKDYKKKPVNKSHSSKGKSEGKRFKVIDSASSTEYSEPNSEGSSLDNSEGKSKDEKSFVKSDKPYHKRNYDNNNFKPYGYQKRNGSRTYKDKHNKYHRSFYQSVPNVPVLPKSYDYETYYKCAKQLAYYLSVENLNKDSFLVENLMDKAGYVQLSSLINFKLLKIASKEGNFEIIMTTLYMILANHLGLAHEDKIEIGLLPNTSEYIGTDEFGVQFAYDFYVLRNRSWSIPEETREKITKAFKPVVVFHANDFYSYSIPKPEQKEQKEEDEKIETNDEVKQEEQPTEIQESS